MKKTIALVLSLLLAAGGTVSCRKEKENDLLTLKYNYDLSEYIYDVSSLALREGHHVAHSYKKKVHQFRNRIPYTVRPATAEDLDVGRDLLDTKLMGILTPRPHEVRSKFAALYVHFLLLGFR